MDGPVTVSPLCPLSTGSVLARVHGELRAVVIAKASFALRHERSAWPTAPLPLIEQDQRSGGSPAGSVAAASDRVPFLPDCGVILTGAAHAPGGDPTPSMTVRLAIFRGTRALLDKPLHVYGPSSPEAPSPRPFTTMPLTYERAFGGPAVPDNPVGVGAEEGTPFPSVANPRDARRPAGFGPIATTWSPRREGLRGLVDHAGEIEVPESVPWSALHAAPPDQRIAYLRGDEWIVLDGLHADFPRVQTHLPFARAEARYARKDGRGPVLPIPLFADTLAIDAELLVASVTWRGYLMIRSASEASAMHVLVGLDLPGAPVSWPDPGPSDAAPLAELVDELSGSWPAFRETTTKHELMAIAAALESESTPPPSFRNDATADVSASFQVALPFHEGQADARAARRRSRPPRDIDDPRSVTGEVILRELPPELPFRASADEHTVDGPDRTVDVDAHRLKSALPFAADATPALPPRWVEDPAPHPGSGTGELDPKVFGKPLPWGRPELPTIPLDEGAPDAADTPAPAPASVDVRALVEARHAAGESLASFVFAGKDLSGANLAGADLRGLDLRRANLTGSNLAGADLADASFDGATLARADLAGVRGDGARFCDVRAEGARFSRSSLVGADFEGATLDGADFEAAALDRARFLDSALGEARFVGARGEGAIFDGARLRKATFARASLSSASFRFSRAAESTWDGAVLDGASFAGADLTKASLLRARAKGASFEEALLPGANLTRLSAPEAVFSRASLARATLRQAHLENASLDAADLRDVEAKLADLSGAKLPGADLGGAALREARLVGADLTGARLDRADLRDANLEGAVVTSASRTNTKLAGASTSGLVDESEDAGA